MPSQLQKEGVGLKSVKKWAATALLVAMPICTVACGGAAPASSTPAQATTSGAASSSAAASTASGAKAAPAVKMTVGYPEAVATFTPVFAAAAQGYFAQNGIDASLELVHGPQEVAALTAGSLQVALAGAPSVMDADLGGGSLVMVASLSPYPIYHLDVAPSIKTPSDLVGKTVGVPVVGGVGDEFLRLYLKNNNLTGKVKITALGSEPALLAALKRGIIVGAMFNPPATAEAEQAGFPALMNSLKLGLPFANNAVDITRAYLSSNQGAVKGFLKAFVQGWKFVAAPANKAAVLSIIQKYTKSTATQAEAAYAATQPVWASTSLPTMDAKAVANVLPFLKSPKAATANPQQFYDNSLLQGLAGS